MIQGLIKQEGPNSKTFGERRRIENNQILKNNH